MERVHKFIGIRILVQIRLVSFLFVVLAASLFPSQVAAQSFKMKVSKKASGFHLPLSYMGKVIEVTFPQNEHVIFAVEDLVQLLGHKNDILVGEVANIENYIAFVDSSGKGARRMILYDPQWDFGMQYRFILAHEVAHHVCKHTLGASQSSNLEQELEADRAAGAILRRAHDARQSVGGMTVDYEGLVADLNGSELARSKSSGSHPDGPLRIAAFIEGWKHGSPCFEKGYQPKNPKR